MEAALDFLGELRSLHCGSALEQKMASKSADLIRQFGKEIDAAFMAFHERKVCSYCPIYSLIQYIPLAGTFKRAVQQAVALIHPELQTRAALAVM